MSVDPPTTLFARDDFDGRFAFELLSEASAEEIEQAVRAAGDVGNVEMSLTQLSSAPGESLGIPQVRVDRRRMEKLTERRGAFKAGTASLRLGRHLGRGGQGRQDDCSLEAVRTVPAHDPSPVP